ncbi:MAG: HYR domain-containing protein [Saprospiraceae bacterium]|nr:HYR domain-containing protein [Saprospiraceae bacterium]
MAITPNNITVCLGETGKIDLQYFEQMVPACLVDPVTGIGPAQIQYIVTSSDPLVVAPGILNSLPFNQPELMWMGENGENFPNVVTIGVTPRITLDGVSCDGAEVKFSITVQPNFQTDVPWFVNPNTSVQCEDNNGWIFHTGFTTAPDVNGFTGPFAPANWTFNNNGGNGTVDVSGAPNSVSLTSNNAGGFNLSTTYCITMPATGTVTFDWQYTTNDVGGPFWDAFGVSINGVFTQLSVDAGPFVQSGTYISPVLNAGDEFCFVQASFHGIFGSATTISNMFLFMGTPDEVETTLGCTYELYYNLSTSPLAEPIGNALVQTIAGDGNPVSFQPVFVPGTYQIWQRCGGCAELVTSFNVSTVAQPELTDQLIEACPVTPGANTGLFEGIEYVLPSVPAPQTLTVEGYYQTFNGAVNGGATGLISATGDFNYSSSDATIYVRIGHDVDGLPGIDCYYVGTIELRVVNRPIVILTAQDNPACIYQDVTLTANVLAGSGSGYTYAWERVSPDPGAITDATPSVVVTETAPGDYVYRVTVTDPNTGVNGADGPACITVADITVSFVGPIITCPADFTASTDAGACNTYVNLVPATVHHVCVDEFVVRYWVTGATTIGSADAPVTLAAVHAVPFNTGVNTVHAVAGTFFLNEFIALDLPEAECSYTVTVLDREPPIARCKDITVFLNAAGQATVTADMVNGGSSDNCGVVEAFICPEVEGFTGQFDVSNWTFNNNGGDGTVDLSNAPNSISLTGSNNGLGVNTTLCITIPANGTLTFSWDYTTLDTDGPFFDPFGVLINGLPTVLTDNSGPSSQSGSYSVTLSAGDEFCFNQGSFDGIFGAATTINSLFLFTSNQLPCTFTCENVGQNDVVLVVRDAAGNASSCIANVTVVDAIAPTLVCPANIVQNVDPDTGCTWTSEVLEPVTLTDNCGVASLSYTILNPDQTLANGSGPVDDYAFAKGTSVVTYTAVDVNGNSSVCSFTVTVNDNVAPQFANCPDNITINLTNSGFTVLPTAPVGGFDISIPTTGNGCAVNLGYTAPSASDNCPMFVVQLVNGKGSAIQTYLAGTHTETYVVTDMSGNTAICSFTITVNDTRDPFITCPADVTVGTDPSFGCTASVPLQPTFGDNCNVVSVSHYFSNGTNAPSQLPSGAVSAATAAAGFTSGLFYPGVNGVSGTTVVTFIATDVAGNTSSCSVNVTVVDDDAPFIMCPIDITLNANATCQGVLSAPYAPMVADNCGGAGLTVTYVIEGATTASSAATGVNPVPVTQTFNLGVSFITFTVTDAAGNTAKCTATVTVLDRTAPVLTCPTVQPVYNTPANQCFVALNLVATATDNCSVASINYFNPSFNAGANASGNYAPGFYTIDWVATDGSGNTSVCSVSFEVRDVVAPSITCPGNATLTTGAGNTTCTAQYNWTHPAPTDNCAVTSYSYRIELPNGSIVGPLTLSNLLVPAPPASAYNASYNFPLGTSRVRYYVSDARGNQTVCFFDVTVSDNTPPVFTQYPVSFTATSAVDLCASVVNWANPIATDNCGPVTVVRTDTNPAQGTIWPTGTYTITYVATDAANNSAVCSFTVNVVDTQNPNVFCPSVTQTFQTNPGTCTWNSAGSNAVSPRFQFDNCPYTLTYTITGATTASGSNDATGVVFNLGTSTVTYRIMETNGTLVGQCSFDIVVVDREVPEITCSMVGALPSQPWINEFHYDNVGTDVGEFIEIAGPIGFNLANCAIVLYNGATPGAAVVYNTTTLSGTIPSPQTGTPVINGAFDGVGTWGNALAVADGVAGWAGANAQALYMTEDNTYYYLGAQVSAAGWQSWGFLINTRPGGGTSDSWLRQITYGHADAPDYIFRGTFGGYAEFHTYNSMTNTWQGIGSSIPGTEFNANPGGFVEVRIPKSTIGVDRIKNVQFFITGDNNSHGTFDAVPNDEIVTSWNPANKTVLDNYANAPMFGYVVVNYPQDGIQNGPNDGMALVCNGMVLQLLSYEGPFTAANGPAAGMTSVDVVVSQQPAPAIGTSLQFQGAGTVGTWVGPITSTPGQINTGQSIVPTGSVVNNAPGQCGAVVTGIFATATDNCTANPAITNNSPYGTSNASGFYAVGNHTVTFTATDASGNTSQCSVSFTVRDVEAPQVNCTSIAPMTPQMTELFVCERQFNWLHPIPTDNCGVTVYTYSITNPDGTIAGPFTLAQVLAGGSRNAGYDFEKGMSTVTYFVQDAAGNTGSCSFNITVVDQQMPYFANCPTMIMSGNDVDRCDAKVNWTIPHAFDNCTLPVTVTPLPGNQYVPGAVIPVGTHTIGYIATDSDGNTAVCTFQIIVNDTQKPDIFPGKPQNVTVECDNIPAPLVLNANDVRDNCDPNPVRGFTQTSTQNPNPALCGHYNYTLDRNWTVTDNSGNVQLWNQVVTVRDTKAPEITVPLDVTVQCNGQYTTRSFTCNAGLGQYAPTVAQYSVNGVNTGIATAVDNCAPNQFICIEFTETFTPGSCGFTGLITRTWTATDPCGNRSQGVQRITIVDTTPPSFTCQDITVNLDATGNVTISAGQLIVGGIAAVVENCSATNQITFQLSKSQFNCTNIGVNQVLLVVTDACGNSAACQRNVTVRDVTPPVITCPASVTISLQGGECVGYFTSSASATDNCGASITYSPSISQPFPIGVTTVVATATDLGGNTATCSFTVTVREHVPTTNALACNNNVNLSLDGNCEAVIRADMILEGNNYRCYDKYCISIQTLTGQPKANFFTLADVGKTFRVMITDCEGSNNTCWGFVTIEEKLIPEIECPANLTVSCAQDLLARNAQGRLITGEARLISCEPGATITFLDNFVDNGQCASPRGILYRTWRVTDLDGNSATCVQTITVRNLNLNDIVWPADRGLENPIECSDAALNPALTTPAFTGWPTLNGIQVNRTGNLCMVALNVSDEIYDVCPGSYEILRTWKVRNMCLPVGPNNPATHIQVIKVLDTKGPKIAVCPSDTIISVDPWGCTASSFLPVPEKIEDLCSNVSFKATLYGPGQVVVTGSVAAKNLRVQVRNVPKGSYVVQYEFTDECGNKTNCVFTITVRDFVAPVAIAKRDIVIGLVPGFDGQGVQECTG